MPTSIKADFGEIESPGEGVRFQSTLRTFLQPLPHTTYLHIPTSPHNLKDAYNPKVAAAAQERKSMCKEILFHNPHKEGPDSKDLA